MDTSALETSQYIMTNNKLITASVVDLTVTAGDENVSSRLTDKYNTDVNLRRNHSPKTRLFSPPRIAHNIRPGTSLRTAISSTKPPVRP